MTHSPTIRIWYEGLHVSRARSEGGADLLPLLSLSAGDHIHGRLRLEIAGRDLPSLGYAGHLGSEACFQAWLPQLQNVADAFLKQESVTCLYGESEQGQPEFLFERRGEKGFLSIVDSRVTDGKADPAWQRTEFVSDEFLVTYKQFRESFLSTIRDQAPRYGDEWIARLTFRGSVGA
jgi:hypothetical protein